MVGPVSMNLPRHHSLAHLHILSCLNTLLSTKLSQRNDDNAPIRILDIGCGDGRMVSYLQAALNKLYPHRAIELYGFDISEQGWSLSEEYLRAIAELERECPGIAWSERVQLISAKEPWPYAPGFFDAAVSNVVLEHVEDADPFFASLRRVLKPDAVSVHLFPLAHMVVEGHVKVPLAHWIRDMEVQRSWIALSNWLGIGRWRRDKELFGEPDLTHYAKSQSAFLHCCTFYRSFEDMYALCRRHGFGLSYCFTPQFFFAKLRSVFNMQPKLHYGRGGIAGFRWLPFLILRYVSASTLVITPMSYDMGARIHAEKELRTRRESRSKAVA